MNELVKNIEFLLMDCDGVLTDGRLYFSAEGETLKTFFVRDGQGLVLWHTAGYRSGIISGRNSPILEMRAKQLGVEFIFQGRNEKVSAFHDVIHSAGISAEEVAFIGDDTSDAAVFPFVGFAVAVGDAHDAVKAAAHHVTNANGGRGAVRELIDMILEAKKS